jgi:hypothetical protein
MPSFAFEGARHATTFPLPSNPATPDVFERRRCAERRDANSLAADKADLHLGCLVDDRSEDIGRAPTVRRYAETVRLRG